MNIKGIEFSYNRNKGNPTGICFFNINVETFTEQREGEPKVRVFSVYRNNGERTLVFSRKRCFIETCED